ncbi:MAG TPA: NapC/NirT family cytochrome c [Longimicrobiales bacterium]|nr:NapC/NirT family cytochrome c [Longimicrobiales bacterium]
MSRLGSLLARIGTRLRSLHPAILVIGGVVLATGLVVGSVFAYRTYDYVQHDNQFCLECHLMREPFERFAQSAHRDLGCKACHRPNLMERSDMALAQILENPDSIRVHAEVPNAVCAECHIEGDPERWRQVANTAGHRVHLESDEPGMDGLLCVECHSSSVHEFTPSEMTCGGCHEDTSIQLGAMADLTIHCATCHEFTAPAPGGTELAGALRPASDQCLGCHQMQSMLPDFPADEPHDAECGVCHDPHTQTTPQQAAETCEGCHEQVEDETPFHQGLEPGVLADCVACHTAHEFHVSDPGNCVSCHTDIFQDARAGPISAAGSGAGVRASAGVTGARGHQTGSGPAVRDGFSALALASHGGTAAPPQEMARDFRHAEHRDVECTACHSMERTHGERLVTGIADCRACHHSEPLATPCEACHQAAADMPRAFTARRTLDIHVGDLDGPVRDLPFSHRQHTETACVACHTQGLQLSAATISCSSCHEAHHDPNTTCRACHEPPREGAHDAQVHLGCTECHEATPEPVQGVPRTREFCLVCHQDLVDHRPGQSCEQCHALPRPTGGGGGGGLQ